MSILTKMIDVNEVNHHYTVKEEEQIYVDNYDNIVCIIQRRCSALCFFCLVIVLVNFLGSTVVFSVRYDNRDL